jgi:hypothetical protein
VQYGDNAYNIDPSAVYQDVLAAIKNEDPNAYIEEIRQYQYQIAFYVNHPTWTKTALATKPLLVGLIVLIAIAITMVLTGIGIAVPAITNYILEMRTYVAKDPDTGETVEIVGYSAYLAWLAQHDPDALTALKDYNATNWWEQITDWIPIVLILIGAAIFIPLISKLIPGGKKE